MQQNKSKSKSLDLLLHKGYVYKKQRSLVDAVAYECRHFRCGGCRGRIFVRRDQVIVKNRHTHPPLLGSTQAVQAKQATRKGLAASTQEPTQVMSGSLSERSTQSVQAKQAREGGATSTQEPTQVMSSSLRLRLLDLGASEKLLKEIEFLRRNKRRQLFLPVPATSDDLDLPPPVPSPEQILSDQTQYLLYDSSGYTNRILIFGTNAGLHLLAASEHWLLQHPLDDVTVQTDPPLSGGYRQQLQTICCVAEGHVVPVLYCFLPDKFRESYRRLLSAIIGLNIDLAPTPRTVMMDFDQFAMQAVTEFFPNAEISGCYFDFCDAIYHRFKEEEDRLVTDHDQDQDFALAARMLASLAFVPPRHVANAFAQLVDTLPDEFLFLADYVEDAFIGRERRGRYSPPQFPTEMWSVYNRVNEFLPTTTKNGAVELGRRSSLGGSAGGHHVDFWWYIDAFRAEERQVKLRQWQLDEDRLVHLVQMFDEQHILEYLRAIAMTFTW